MVLSENEGQFNRLLVCLLQVICYISSSSPHQNLHYSSIYFFTYHSQPECHFHSIKAIPNLHFNHTFTISKLPFVNPNPSSTFEPPLSFEMASNPTKSSKRKQGECSQAFSIGWIRGSLMKITRLTSRSSFWNVRIPKFLDLEWFYQ